MRSFVLFLPFVVLFQSFDCAYGNPLTLTDRTLIEKLSYMLPDFLWFKSDCIDLFPAFATEIRNIPTFWSEIIFSFFPERRNIHEICIGSGHKSRIIKIRIITSYVSFVFLLSFFWNGLMSSVFHHSMIAKTVIPIKDITPQIRIILSGTLFRVLSKNSQGITIILSSSWKDLLFILK